MNAEGSLPCRICVRVDENEVIYQKLLYPGLQTKCETCGSTNHLKEDCTMKPWIAALVGPAPHKDAEDVSNLAMDMDRLQVGGSKAIGSVDKVGEGINLEGMVMTPF